MPLYQRLISFDRYTENLKHPIIVANELPNKTAEDRAAIDMLVNETYTSDMISVVPRCACPDGQGLRGEHVIGEECEECGTVVHRTIEEDIAATLWFRRPEGVEKLINPTILIMLMKRFTRSKFRIIPWLIDRNYDPRVKMPDVVHRIISDGVPRGYNNFVENFDAIIRYLFELPEFKFKKKAGNPVEGLVGIAHPSGDPLQQLIEEQRHALFSDMLPLQNRALLVIDKNATGVWAEETIFDIRNIINTMVSIDRDFYDRGKPHKVENRTGKILTMLADYYDHYNKVNYDPKEGQMRKHVYGSRANHGFRAVITSHEDIHDHDEIYVPWCAAVATFRLHIMRFLMDRTHPFGGMTHNEAIGLLFSSVYQYNERIDQIFQHLIKTCRNGRGICILQQRNPTLEQGSAQRVYMTKVKTDPNDTTVSMSDLICAAYNALNY